MEERGLFFLEFHATVHYQRKSEIALKKGRNLDAGADAEAMAHGILMACPSWLKQIVQDQQPMHGTNWSNNIYLKGLWDKKWGQYPGMIRFILSQDSAIQLLRIYPKRASSYHRDTHSAMFISFFFIKARNCKQPIVKGCVCYFKLNLSWKDI